MYHKHMEVLHLFSLTVPSWKERSLTVHDTAAAHQCVHHKANVSLKNLRTVVPTDVEDVISVWYEIYNKSK